jgi:hypothetical protein
MRKLLILIASLCISIQAQAGFVDERSAPAPAATTESGAADKALPVDKSRASASSQAAPAPVAQSWDIQLKDINIANVFHRWANKAGYRVRWDAQKHFMVEAPDNLTGSFEDVVNAVLESPGIAKGAYPLEVCFYPNTPPLARITRQGDQDKECK